MVDQPVVILPLISMPVPSVGTPGALFAAALPKPVGLRSTEFFGNVAQAGATDVAVGDIRRPSTAQVAGAVA